MPALNGAPPSTTLNDIVMHINLHPPQGPNVENQNVTSSCPRAAGAPLTVLEFVLGEIRQTEYVPPVVVSTLWRICQPEEAELSIFGGKHSILTIIVIPFMICEYPCDYSPSP